VTPAQAKEFFFANPVVSAAAPDGTKMKSTVPANGTDHDEWDANRPK
jgi:hypothetical protein